MSHATAAVVHYNMQFTLHKELWNDLIYLPSSTWCGKFLAASLSLVSICVAVAPLVFLGTGGGFDSPPLAGTGGGTGSPPMTVVPAPTTTTSSYDCVALCFGTMILISAYCTVASDCIGFATLPLGTWPKSEYIGSLVAPVALAAPDWSLSVKCFFYEEKNYNQTPSFYLSFFLFIRINSISLKLF